MKITDRAIRLQMLSLECMFNEFWGMYEFYNQAYIQELRTHNPHLEIPELWPSKLNVLNVKTRTSNQGGR